MNVWKLLIVHDLLYKGFFLDSFVLWKKQFVEKNAIIVWWRIVSRHVIVTWLQKVSWNWYMLNSSSQMIDSVKLIPEILPCVIS